MNTIKHTIFLLIFLIDSIYGLAQQEYTEIKNQFCMNVNSQLVLLNTKDDLSFIMAPLTELKLNSHYILSDFRRALHRDPRTKDISALRLYVRNVKLARPDDSYFDKEYSRYLKCKKNKVAYKKTKNNVPYIWPFRKIRLKGTQMSIWQAYLLDRCSSLFGMRNEANYNQEHILTSTQDVDSIISLIRNSWDSYYFCSKENSSDERMYVSKHIKEAKIVIDSLQKIKRNKLEPLFEYHADSVTIEHYSFLEFYGLFKYRTTLRLSHKYHYVREFRKRAYELVAKYIRNVYY